MKVLGSKDAVEIEVEASDRIVPQTQSSDGPDRLVIDFPNAFPAGSCAVSRWIAGEVKDLRIGLFQSQPPVTRLVLDLKTAQSFQIFPSGRTVIIKVMGGACRQCRRSSAGSWTPPLLRTGQAPGPGGCQLHHPCGTRQAETSAQPLLDVTFRDGLLGIRANKVTLSEVLFAVQQRTGAQVAIAAGAETGTSGGGHCAGTRARSSGAPARMVRNLIF